MKQTIELPVGELKTALSGLNKIITSRNSLPVLSHVRLSQEVTGHVTIEATDLDSFASYRFNDPLVYAIEPVLIPYDSLTRQIKGMTAKERLDIVPRSKEKAFFAYELGGGRVEQAVDTLDPDQWPKGPAIQIPEPSLLPPGFKPFLREALECASEEETRYILNGAFIDVSQKEAHYLVGTNGRILYSANSFNFALAQSVILPRRKFLNWAGFVEDGDWSMAAVQWMEEKTSIEMGWARITSAHWSLLTKVISGVYPHWRQVVPDPQGVKTTVQFDPKAADLLLSVLPRLPGNDVANETVHFLIRPDSFVVRGYDRGSRQWTEVPIPGTWVTGEPIEIALNRQYVMRALRFGLTQMDMSDSLSAAIFRAVGRQLVVMPLRSDGPTADPVPANPGPGGPNNNNPPSQPEAAQAVTPSTDQPTTPTEPETKETMSSNTPSAPQPASAPQPQTKPESEEDGSPFKAAMQEIEKLKELLRGAAGTLHTIIGLLKSAEREQKAASKEVESVRAKLREIQSVKI